MKEYIKSLFKKHENFKGWNFYFDKHPVMVLFYSLLTIAFVLVVSFTALNLIMVILVSSKMIVQPVSNNLSFYYLGNFLVNASANSMYLGFLGEFLKPAIYTDIFGNHSFIMSLVGYIIRTMPTIFFLIYFRQILFSAITNNPFEKKNITRLRIVGLIFLLTPFIIVLSVSIFDLTGFSRNLISFSNLMKMSVSYGFYNFYNIVGNIHFLFGAFILVVAEVFKLGINLKEENDLTV